jgi:protein TonB
VVSAAPEAPAPAPIAAAPFASPDYERNPPPAYPLLARKRAWQGIVLLEVRVNSGGDVDSLRVKQASGHTILDQAALRAVRDWRFRPASAAGLPIAATVEVPVRFLLE